MNVQNIALDTSVLCRPFDRRFVMAIWELFGSKVPILPRVAKELYGTMSDSENDYWWKHLKWQENGGHQTYSTAQKQIIAREAVNGLRHWFTEYIDTQFDNGSPPNNCALKAVLMTAEEVGRAGEIAASIPQFCFRGPSHNDHYGDRAVIAEALVSNHQVLASRNRTSIRRQRTNQWLKETFGLNTDLVCEADDIVAAMSQEAGLNPDKRALEAVLLATLPGHKTSVERESGIVERFLSVLASSSFPDCADGALGVWRSNDGVEVLNQVRPKLALSIARSTEAKRIESIRDFASNAGWNG